VPGEKYMAIKASIKISDGDTPLKRYQAGQDPFPDDDIPF
jgi:hypothetical protein